jgi:rod shape-determining protein MreD
MLALDLIDRRTQWRDYWIEWIVAAVLIAINEWLQWRVAKFAGAAVPFAQLVPPLVISVCAFPAFAWVVWRIDVWRLAR